MTNGISYIKWYKPIKIPLVAATNRNPVMVCNTTELYRLLDLTPQSVELVSFYFNGNNYLRSMWNAILRQHRRYDNGLGSTPGTSFDRT